MLNAQRNENTNVTIYIGTYLKHRRKAVGLTGAQLASRLNISQQQVSRYERGKKFHYYSRSFGYFTSS